ncbi:MAG: hypothetical protein JWO11_864 [Nocardioides sp.]|nr:hypothetical protein [Nocardioides sp.]
MGQSKTDRDAATRKIKEKICAEFGVRPSEVVLKDNHDIVIDRRRTDPRAVPFVIAKWS